MNYGTELPVREYLQESGNEYLLSLDWQDQVENLNSVLEKQVSLLSDVSAGYFPVILSNAGLIARFKVRDLVKERAALEKDYAQKLQAIARKAAEKRARTAASRVVGDDAVKAHSDELLKRK